MTKDEALRMAIGAMEGYRRELSLFIDNGAKQPCDAEFACKEALVQPAREWQRLSYGEINEILEKTPYVEYGSWIEFAQDIEMHVKEKNTL